MTASETGHYQAITLLIESRSSVVPLTTEPHGERPWYSVDCAGGGVRIAGIRRGGHRLERRARTLSRLRLVEVVELDFDFEPWPWPFARSMRRASPLTGPASQGKPEVTTAAYS